MTTLRDTTSLPLIRGSIHLPEGCVLRGASAYVHLVEITSVAEPRIERVTVVANIDGNAPIEFSMHGEMPRVDGNYIVTAIVKVNPDPTQPEDEVEMERGDYSTTVPCSVVLSASAPAEVRIEVFEYAGPAFPLKKVERIEKEIYSSDRISVKISVRIAQEGDQYVAHALGCVSQGSTRDEALRNITEAVESKLEGESAAAARGYQQLNQQMDEARGAGDLNKPSVPVFVDDPAMHDGSVFVPGDWRDPKNRR